MRHILSITMMVGVLHAYAQSGIYISQWQAREDIAYFDSMLQQVHVNPWLHISQRNFEKHVQKISGELPDSLLIEDFILNMHCITAALNDAHTAPDFIQNPLLAELKKEQFLYLPFTRIKDKLYIAPNTLHLAVPAGSEITSINSYPVKSLLKRFTQWYGGTHEFRMEMGSRFLPYFLFLQHIYPPYIMDCKTPEGKRSTMTLTRQVSFGKALQLLIPSLSHAWGYEIKNQQLGWITLNAMQGDLMQWGHFLDSAFIDMEQHGIQHLAIDIRNNPGGNSMFADVLFSLLTRKPYTLSAGKTWKISEPYKNYLLSQGDSANLYHQQPAGSVWKMGSCDPEPNMWESDRLFGGKVYLITGPFTFSSANMLADGFKTLHLGTLIGEPTGEYTNDFGEVFSFNLPHSGIGMKVTTAYFMGARCGNHRFYTVSPDIVVHPDAAHIARGEDPVLQYLLSQIP